METIRRLWDRWIGYLWDRMDHVEKYDFSNPHRLYFGIYKMLFWGSLYLAFRYWLFTLLSIFWAYVD